jgi:hypothetical protein
MLETFINSGSSEDTETGRDVFKRFIKEKAKMALEAANTEAKAKENGFELEGDNLKCNGKSIGKISYNNGEEDAVCFTNTKGKTIKGKTLENVYDAIAKEQKVSEGLVDDALAAQSIKKSERAARLAASKKKAPGDGKAGEYVSHDKSEYSDKIKGSSDEVAFTGHDGDARAKKGFYDKADPRAKHNAGAKGKKVDGGKAAPEPAEGYTATDVRSKHNS